MFRNQSIFATRTMNRTTKSVRLLYDRLTSFDLVKSGKFTLRSRKQFSQVSHVPFEGHGLLFYHLFDFGCFPEPN